MLLRIVFTITLLHPKIELSLKIYNNYVKPFLESHEKSIDTGLGKVINEGKQILANGASEAIKKIV